MLTRVMLLILDLQTNKIKKFMAKNIPFKYVIIIVLTLVAIGALGRLLPHAWNATPVTAAALFAGYLLGWRYAIIVPALVMLLSDIFIGFDTIQMTMVIYGSFILMGFLGILLRKHRSFETFLAGGIVASTMFFLTTNAAVWFFTTMYPPTFEGLMLSYTMGLPFFKNMIIGDLFYVAMFYGAYRAVEFFVVQKVSIKKARVLEN
jgi:hypothetical protein